MEGSRVRLCSRQAAGGLVERMDVPSGIDYRLPTGAGGFQQVRRLIVAVVPLDTQPTGTHRGNGIGVGRDR